MSSYFDRNPQRVPQAPVAPPPAPMPMSAQPFGTVPSIRNVVTEGGNYVPETTRLLGNEEWVLEAELLAAEAATKVLRTLTAQRLTKLHDAVMDAYTATGTAPAALLGEYTLLAGE